MLSGNLYPTLSLVIPCLHEIEENLKALQSAPDCPDLVKFLLQEFRVRFAAYKSCRSNAIATLCDPRFKEVLLEPTWVKAEVLREVRLHQGTCTGRLADQADSTALQPSVAGSISSSFMTSFLQKARQRDTVVSDSFETEYDSYIANQLLPLEADPLDYWRQHGSAFPNIAKLARVYLAIPATEVESERVFSASGYAMGTRRCSLLPSNLEKIVFLNFNFK